MSAVSDALAPHVDRGEVTGAVAVVGRGTDLEVTVVGDQALGGPPMREDSLFRIASAGKPITAAAALTLVADGHLRLDDPVGDLLPELATPRVLRTPTAALDDTVAAVRPITVRDLLRSTNGLGFPSDFSSPVVSVLTEQLHQGSSLLQDVPSPDEWITQVGTVPLLHQPGEGFTYNTAYDVLGVLVERASGRPFARYVSERVLEPLGMSDTGFAFPPDAVDRATTQYRTGEDGALVVTDPPDGQWTTEPAFTSGAGGYVSTAADLVSFLRMLLAGGDDVLPPQLVTEMTTDQLTPAIRATDTAFLDGQSWGYGGGVDIAILQPWSVIGRYGWVGGTGTSAYLVPSDASIAIVLTQTELGPAGAAVLESFWASAARQLDHDA